MNKYLNEIKLNKIKLLSITMIIARKASKIGKSVCA